MYFSNPPLDTPLKMYNLLCICNNNNLREFTFSGVLIRYFSVERLRTKNMTYISLFKNVAKSFKVHIDKPVIDDFIFQCHYKLTTNILFMFCILITSINLIG